MPDAQLRINAPHVVHETIDGETILIHLGTGAYYSLDGAGAQVWGLLAAGVRERDALAAVQAHYDDADPRLVADAIGALVRQLLDEGLLVTGEDADGQAAGAATGACVDPGEADPGEGEAAGAPTSGTYADTSISTSPDFAAPASPAPTQFVAPVLSKYTDMQEFMLVDPIHDVEEEAGWPHVKAG